MNRIYKYIACCISAAVMTGCSQYIDLEPKDRLTEDIAFSTLDGLEGAILGLYERARNPYESNDASTWNVVGTDEVQPGSHLPDQPIVQAFNNYNFSLNPDNGGVRSLWEIHYVGLHRANVILKNVEVVEINENDPGQVRRKDHIRGTALWFRSYFHLKLVQRWDNIVLRTDAPDVVEYDVKKAEKSAVYTQIEQDLLDAIDLLPEAIAAHGNASVSKGVARHLLSKAYLDMGQYAKAAQFAYEVINDPAYSLEPLDIIFSEDHQDNKEVIFAWQFTVANRNRAQRIVQQYLPLYDRINGVARTFEYGGRPWARLYPSTYLMNLYEPGDKRWEAYYITEYRWNDAANLPPGVQLGDVVTPQQVAAQGQDVRHITPTTKKFLESDKLGRGIGDAEGFKNVIEYRLAEAYLIAAEGVMRSGTPVGGNSATDFINVLRERAGVAPFTELDEEKLLEEHIRELAFEGHRYAMLKRLGLLVQRAKLHNPGASQNIQDHHVRWPIPRNFVELTGFPQNQGYF